MIRTKGEAGTGDIVEAVKHLRAVRTQIRRLASLSPDELSAEAKLLGAPLDLVTQVAREGHMPVPAFAAGGIATPADAALCMALGAEAVFVGSGIFLSDDAPRRAKAIVAATTYWQDGKKLAEISTGLGQPMRGISARGIAEGERFAPRGW
jgi:pyridoxal 5'-phosphate synthase pdxS subunit